MNYKVETKLGNVWVTPTSAKHIYVDFGHNLNVEHEGPNGSDRHGPLTIRGVQHTGSMHLYPGEEGTWNIGEPGKNDYERRIYLDMTEWGPGRGMKESSEAARKIVAAVVRLDVQEWARKNPKALQQAELESKVDQLDKAGEQIEEKRREVLFLQEEINRLLYEKALLEAELIEDKLQNMEVIG